MPALWLWLLIADPAARAREAERLGDYDAAYLAWGEAGTPAGERRQAWLDARRDEGWASLRLIDGAQGSPRDVARPIWLRVALSSAPAALRADAALWLADDALRAGDPAAALRWVEGLPDDEALSARKADARARALAASGRIDEARAVEAGWAEAPPPPGGWSESAATRRNRRWLRAASWASLCTFFALALGPLRLAAGRGLRPRWAGLAAVAVTGGAAAALAEGWERGLGRGPLWATGALLLVHAFAGPALLARPGGALRGAAFAASWGAAFLALDAAGALGSFGL
jgi:hypothetical protein